MGSRTKKVSQLHTTVITNRDIYLSAPRLLLLAMVRPNLEYGTVIWEANKVEDTL